MAGRNEGAASSRGSLDSSSSSSSRRRTSSLLFDADTTLPLSDDVQARVDRLEVEERRPDDNRGEEDGDDAEEEEDQTTERLLRRMTHNPRSTTGTLFAEEDAGDLLAHLTRLRTYDRRKRDDGDDDDARRDAANVRLVRTAVGAAAASLNDRPSGGGGRRRQRDVVGSGSSASQASSIIMDGRTARRILTDGILPFASAPPSAWIAESVRSVVAEDLLPMAVVLLRDSEGENDRRGDHSDNNNNDDNNTTALEILLSAFLTRMDADESASSPLTPDGSSDATGSGQSATVDDVLDRLCGIDDDDGAHGSRSRLRPAAAAAVLASLRELESNCGGRLSRRRTDNNRQEKVGRGGSGSGPGGGGTRREQRQQFRHVDRPARLLRSALRSLRALSRKDDHRDGGGGGGDPDALPPLVYQLGLLPLGLGTGDGGGGRGRNEESGKQRGARLRRMVLEGIADVLDENDAGGASDANGRGDVVLREGGDGGRNPRDRRGGGSEEEEEEAWRYARYTSLSHLGSCLRSDPEMSRAVLGMLAGDAVAPVVGDDDDDDLRRAAAVPPFRYARLTPFRLAVGLSMASSVPRMRASALGTVRDLILEEETVRVRRGLGVEDERRRRRKVADRPWMDCLARCLEDETSDGRKAGSGGHVLGCLVRIAKFAEGEHHNGGGGGSGGGCASSLLQSLCQLGFLLVDCVKKDEPPRWPSSSANEIRPLTVLAPDADISTFAGGTVVGSTADRSAVHAAAGIGRFVLCYLFYQSAAASSPMLSSSLSSLAAADNHKSAGGGGGGTALCRSILRSSTDKFCGMAPNALEHALLLEDLLHFSPSSSSLKEECRGGGTGGVNGMEGLDDRQKEEVVALALASNHLTVLIDSLSDVPGGGMLPRVASRTLVPTVGRLLLLQVTRRRGCGSLWKRTDAEDHVDRAFLFAKKALFSADVEKRRCAATLLVTLLGAAAVASSAGRASAWSGTLHDVRGCLRRCLTQHQSAVRMEVYDSLVALLPGSAPNGNVANTQDSASPAKSPTSGGETPPRTPSSSQPCDAIMASIPPAGQTAVVGVVSELLLSSLERYATIPKEESTDREARRKRSAAPGGVGLSQMEALAEEDSPAKGTKNDEEDKPSNPFRFEKCISMRPSNLQDNGNGRRGGGGKGKRSRTTPVGQSLLAEALRRINEPLAFLVASCIATVPLLAATNDEDDDDDDDDSTRDNLTSEMKKTLLRIRRQMVRCTNVKEYMAWTKSCRHIFEIKDNAKRAEEMAIGKLATLVLLAVVADVFLNTCDWSEEEAECDNIAIVVATDPGSSTDNDIADLFDLRTEAVEEAAEIMSSFVSAKSQTKKKRKKKLTEIDANLSEQPETKKGGGTAGDGGGLVKVKVSDINDATLARNRKLAEEAIHAACPAMNHEFLAGALRRFGAETHRKACEDTDSDDEDEDKDGDKGAAARLTECLAFRRFVVTKSILLLSESSPTVRAGTHFGAPGVRAVAAADEKSASTARIAASMTLGPLLFVEFCHHCYSLERTSIGTVGEISLAQLSLRAFTTCIRGMARDTRRHPLSPASRVCALLTSATMKASVAVPPSADGWKFYRESDTGDACAGVPDDEARLGEALRPFLSLPMRESSQAVTTQLCLFSELVSNGMHGEATECCHLIFSAAETFTDPNMKEKLGVILLRGWESLGPLSGGENCLAHKGVLGLEHLEEDSGKNDSCCASSAIRVAMKLNCGLDGSTQVCISPKGNEDLRAARSKMGLPTTVVQNWPDAHHKRLEKELISTSGMVGIGTQVAWALLATLGIGNHFLVTFDKNSPTKKQLKLDLIRAASRTSDANFAKEKSSISNTISSSVEDALNNADFVTLKMIPHMLGSSLALAQRFVSCLLFSVSKMISSSAPSADFLDANGGFASTLLKSTKRLYGILAKLILSFMSNPQSLTSNETKCFLDFLTATLMPRVSALLLTLQEKQETAGGKFLAESKIESHGKTSALLVFEKEKLDNALLKLGAKLKQAGLEEDSEWLEDHVVTNLNRDFVIRRVEDAKAREAPKTKKKPEGKKRKVKSEPTADKKNIKKKREAGPEEGEREDGSEDDDEEASAMESVDAESVGDAGEDDDVVSLSRLTADMEDDSDDEDDENNSEGESESEEEAEFDE